MLFKSESSLFAAIKKYPRNRSTASSVFACTSHPSEVIFACLGVRMSRFLDQIFSCQRNRYTDFPPNDLLKRCSVAMNAIDQAELERAQWLWKRRPRYILFDGGKVLWGRLILYILTILFLVSFDIPGLLAASA